MMVADCGMCGVEIEEGKETYIPIDEGKDKTLNVHLCSSCTKKFKEQNNNVNWTYLEDEAEITG